MEKEETQPEEKAEPVVLDKFVAKMIGGMFEESARLSNSIIDDKDKTIRKLEMQLAFSQDDFSCIMKAQQMLSDPKYAKLFINFLYSLEDNGEDWGRNGNDESY